jgi:diacylglycerol kinase (ATP)
MYKILLKALKHLYSAFWHSVAGLKAAYINEFPFRLEVFLSILIVPLSFYFGKGVVEHLLLFFSWMLIWVVELINSAIEAVVDRIGKDRQELSKRAKDMGSAAVFLACVNALVVWFAILFF